MIKQISILIEHDQKAKNYSAYVPAIRLGVVGDTIEETIECVRDLIMLEMEKYRAEGVPFPENTAVVQTIEIDFGEGAV